jgi:hypothetical protein
MLDTPRNTFGSIIRKFTLLGTTENKSGHGRKMKLSIIAIRNIVRTTRNNPHITAKDLLFDLAHTGDEVSLFTIRHTLRSNGLYARTPCHTSLLTEVLYTVHKRNRSNYAKSNLNKPLEIWQSILWTNRTKIELFGKMDQRAVRGQKNSAFDEKKHYSYRKVWRWEHHGLGLFFFFKDWEPGNNKGYHGFR